MTRANLAINRDHIRYAISEPSTLIKYDFRIKFMKGSFFA